MFVLIMYVLFYYVVCKLLITSKYYCVFLSLCFCCFGVFDIFVFMVFLICYVCLCYMY